MSNRAQFLMAALAAAVCLLPSLSTAQLYGVEEDGGDIYCFVDTVMTVVNPSAQIPLSRESLTICYERDGKFLVSCRDYNDYYAPVYRLDPDAQTLTLVDSLDLCDEPAAISRGLGLDMYILVDTWYPKGRGSSRGIADPYIGLLRDGAAPRDTVRRFVDYYYNLIDIQVWQDGDHAGNVATLEWRTDGESDWWDIGEYEMTDSDTLFRLGWRFEDWWPPQSRFPAWTYTMRSIAIMPSGEILLASTDSLYLVDDYGNCTPFGDGLGAGDVEIGPDGAVYALGGSPSYVIRRYNETGERILPDLGALRRMVDLAIGDFVPTPEGEDVLVEPAQGVEITYDEVMQTGLTSAVVETSSSRISPEGNYLPSYAALPGSRADVFTYISLGTDAIYSGLIQVDVLLEGSRLFYASGVGDTFRDFTVVGSIEDARGTIPRFSELPMPGGKSRDTGPTEVVLVEDTRALSDVTDYKFWRLELAMAVPDTVPPCPWGAIHYLRGYVTSARGFRGVGNYGGALHRLSVMNDELRGYGGSCIPESSADSLGNLVGSILAHSKTLMHSLYLEARASADWGDAPDPTYPTLASSNGASHMIDPFVCLGYVLDAEPDGQPDSLSLGDDDDGSNDDDGIAFPTRMFLGRTAEIVVTTWSGGHLSMWLDGNGDGDWSDWGEFLVQGEPVNAGLDTLFVPIYAGFAAGETYARFRLGSETVSAPTGVAPDGEVEDYLVALEPDTCVTWTPDAPVAGGTLTVYYDLDCRGILAPGTNPVYIHIGHSGWQDVISPDPAMTWDAGEGAWRYTLDVPGPAASVEFVFNDGAGGWDNNDGADWSVPVTGGSTGTIYEMDGALDAEASLAGSGTQLDLYVDFDGTWLYVATQGVGATSGLDHFILVDENPSASQGAPWAKAGTVAGWDYFLGNEGDNNWNGWFNSGEILMTSASVLSASEAYLEGALDLRTLYGSIPDSILIAVGGYGTADAAALSDQAPAGNGNGNIERAEYYVLDLPQTGVPEEPDAVSGLPRIDVFPNPVVGGTSIQLSLPTAGKASLSVYDVRGRLVTKLVSETLSDGVHHVRWDGLDGQGRALPSGIYFLRLNACGEHFERKVVLLR